MAVLLGQVGPGVDGANSNSAGVAFAQRLSCIESGTVTSLNIRTGATGPSAGNVHAALYVGGATLTGQVRLSADITGNFAASTIVTFVVSPGVAVVGGTFYWIEWLGVGATFNYTNFAASGGTEIDSSATTCPDPHGTQAGGNANIANVWAEGDPVAGIAAFQAQLEQVGNRRMAPGLKGPGTDRWGGG